MIYIDRLLTWKSWPTLNICSVCQLHKLNKKFEIFEKATSTPPSPSFSLSTFLFLICIFFSPLVKPYFIQVGILKVQQKMLLDLFSWNRKKRKEKGGLWAHLTRKKKINWVSTPQVLKSRISSRTGLDWAIQSKD